MATIPIVLNGVFTSATGSMPGVFTGTATFSLKPDGGDPPGIWPGPGDPDYPIKPPGGGEPPTIWPGPGDPDFPGGGKPPIDPPVDPPYPGHPEWVWGWVIPLQKWMPVYVPGPTDPQPH